jgi:hypothetical protein
MPISGACFGNGSADSRALIDLWGKMGGDTMRRFASMWKDTLTRLGCKKSFHLCYFRRGDVLRRRLRVEGLEDRRLLAVLTVNSIADTDLNTPGDDISTLTLREAISVVNDPSLFGNLSAAEQGQITDPGTLATDATIAFDEAGLFSTAREIQLSIVSGSQSHLMLTEDVTIDGPAALLTLRALDPTGTSNYIDVGDGNRVFDITGAGSPITVTLADLKLTGGDTLYDGGAVRLQNGNSLSLHKVTISENFTVGWGGGVSAVLAGGSHLTITESEIRDNRAIPKRDITDGGGGGVAIRVAPTSPTTPAIVEIAKSTISGNTSGRDGGGLRVHALTPFGPFYYAANISVKETTIHENRAGYSPFSYGASPDAAGGGIDIVTRNATAGNPIAIEITKSTITGNESFHGGGLRLNAETTTTLEIDQTLVADNSPQQFGL